MKFNELNDKDKIRHIKDKYAEILGELVSDKKLLDKLIPEIKDEPILIQKEGNSKEKNDELKISFEKKKLEFEENKSLRSSILDALNKVKEKDNCICEPKELDIDINYILPEFEVFIDFARIRAEAQNY